jgi:hypothetical protein
LSFDIVQSTRHHGDDQNLKPISNTPSSVSLVIPPSLLSPEINPDNKVKVFYNLFTKSVKDAERVQGIVNEQLSLLLSEHHELFSITSFGYKLPLPNIPNNTIRHHYKTGNEGKTLHDILEYSSHPNDNNHETKIIYLRSKGSYNDTPEYKKLRSFLTKGALSKECAGSDDDNDLPDKCNVCSSRMPPLPHPHTPGNMWLARCDYVSKLIDPLAYDN